MQAGIQTNGLIVVVAFIIDEKYKTVNDVCKHLLISNLKIPACAGMTFAPSCSENSQIIFKDSKMFSLRIPLGIVFVLCTATVLFAEKHVAIVAPQPFHQSLAPWIKHRTEQGWNVHVIVEPFGSVTKTTPERVRERVRLLAGQVPLSALLLVGDSVPKQESDFDRVVPSPRLPCRLIQYFGEEKTLASDNWYGDLDDDGIPEIAVGRFSVTTSEQLDAVIRKTLRFESEPNRVERRRLQLVAGVGNFSPLIDASIEGTAKLALTELVPESRDLSLLHLNWKSPFCPDPLAVRREIVTSLGSGALFWAYLGHGLHRMLDPLHTPNGDIPTLTIDDVAAMQSPKGASVALLFCCYGGVPDATTDSLAEEMLRSLGGPVAVFAASRTTMPYGMSVLGIELLRESTAIAEEGLTLGAVILAAERRTVLGTPKVEPVTKTKGPRQRPLRETVDGLAKMLDPIPERLPEQLLEHVALFHLYGDPLLKLPTPKKITLNCPETVAPGSAFRVDGYTPHDQETVSVELTVPVSRLTLNCPDRTEFRDDEKTRQNYRDKYHESNDRVLTSAKTTVVGNVFQVELTVPEGIRGDCSVRAVCCTENDFSLGSTSIKIKRH